MRLLVRGPAPFRAYSVLVLLLVGSATSLTGCCTTAKCLDRNSTPDRNRMRAKPAKLGVVHNDRISAPQGDRTDWKYVDLPQPGKLTAQLHWDIGRAKIQLAIFDVLGVRIQEGRAWGAGGLRSVIAVENPGRYYIRVRGRGKRDASSYALRLLFKAEGAQVQCHRCTEGERRCLGANGFVVCEKVRENCNAWSKVTSCGDGIPCRKGSCVGCADGCVAGSRQCADATTYQRCGPSASGCLIWGASKSCRKGKRCKDGRCVVRPRKRKVKRAAPPPRKKPDPCIRARIISIYSYRGRMTLHIEIGDNPNIKPGQTGTVIESSSGKPLPDGKIKVSRVAGRYAIATTSLEKLGKNRWVRLCK